MPSSRRRWNPLTPLGTALLVIVLLVALVGVWGCGEKPEVTRADLSVLERDLRNAMIDAKCPDLDVTVRIPVSPDGLVVGDNGITVESGGTLEVTGGWTDAP